MDKPKVADTCPKQIEMEAGKKYAYCTCGLSESQPLCDGSHGGTDFRPMIVEATENKTAYFCQCKQTGNAPYCDGSHNDIAQDSAD